MECRNFEITVICASNLPNVREFSQMKVYAKVSIRGSSDPEWITPVDRERETNPYWNCKVKYTLPEKAVQKEGTILAIKLYCERSLLPDKYVGEVNLSLKKLFDCALALENLEFDVDRNDADGILGKLKTSYDFATTKTLVPKKDSFFREVAVGVVLHAVAHGVLHLVLH